MAISTHAYLEGSRVYYKVQETRSPWESQEKKDQKNVFVLQAEKYAILSFSSLQPAVQSHHIQMDSIFALSY